MPLWHGAVNAGMRQAILQDGRNLLLDRELDAERLVRAELSMLCGERHCSMRSKISRATFARFLTITKHYLGMQKMKRFENYIGVRIDGRRSCCSPADVIIRNHDALLEAIHTFERSFFTCVVSCFARCSGRHILHCTAAAAAAHFRLVELTDILNSTMVRHASPAKGDELL
jgi:hypothetical protein